MADDDQLYVVYLGGEAGPGRMGEDHQVVLVAAPSVSLARHRARKKWTGTGRAHVDALAEVRRVDGFDVRLERSGRDGHDVELDPTYVP